MKKYIYNIFAVLFAATAITSCTEENGTEPGNDSAPSVIVYQYAAARPNNPDNDVVLRFASNSKANEVYYLAEKTTEMEANLSAKGEEGYMDYVVSSGTKVSGLSGEGYADVTITDLFGSYTITAVAVNGAMKSSNSVTFTGLDWSNVVTGTYYFEAVPSLGLDPVHTTLQVCTTDATLYRFKDLFGAGYSMKIKLLDITGSDSDGEYTYFRVPATETPYTYGNYGAIGVRDIGYWQGSDAWVTSYGYESGMYSNYNCFICVQYYVSAGNLGYNYDFFEVD